MAPLRREPKGPQCAVVVAGDIGQRASGKVPSVMRAAEHATQAVRVRPDDTTCQSAERQAGRDVTSAREFVMVMSDTVTVYSFLVFDGGPETAQIAGFKATREAIERVPGGRVVEGTGQDVAAAELDRRGRYRRIATGWGALDEG